MGPKTCGIIDELQPEYLRLAVDSNNLFRELDVKIGKLPFSIFKAVPENKWRKPGNNYVFELLVGALAEIDENDQAWSGPKKYRTT